MPNLILAEHSPSVSLTITLASLANNSSRQSTMVNNNDNAQMVRVFYKITTGATPTDKETIQLYVLSGNLAGVPIRTDNAGATDAAITIETAPLGDVIQVDATPDKTYRGSFLIRNPGPEWGIGVKNDSGFALNATTSNHEISFVNESVEVQ